MINGIFSRAPLHEHADPAQRIVGLADLEPTSATLIELLARDPSPEVRIAAAQRCGDAQALMRSYSSEPDPSVKEAVGSALGAALAQQQDAAAVQTTLRSEELTDAIRAEVARRTQDAEVRRSAIAAIAAEESLIELALAGEHADVRMTAAERVSSWDGLRKLAESARNKDSGVARLARSRIDEIKTRQDQSAEADAIIGEMEALQHKAGPVLTDTVDLNRRWQSVNVSADPERLQRFEAARKQLQIRLDRDQDELQFKSRFEARAREWIAALPTQAEFAAIEQLRTELVDLRREASDHHLAQFAADFDAAEARIARLSDEQQVLASAEALVIEAEKMAADTTIDPGTLPQRWQALDRSIRTPALTSRFETALIIVEQRRLAHIQIAHQEAAALRQHIHTLLHAAEQAIAAGQLREARSAVDQLKPLRGGAGTLPKPTLQRLSRLLQQLVELERWQSFGQQNARVQLCERAEAAAELKVPRDIAQEIQKLRNEWKVLDQQYAGVPKALWERFDGACEKAYAPAARYFAELNQQRKQARTQREEFIAQVQVHAPTLLTDSPDWRAIERWLREVEGKWREGELGSLEPRLWKKYDADFKAALAPARDALTAAREEAKSRRRALIEEAGQLSAAALDREAPSKVKALQARWQELAKTVTLAQRDERQLWDQFRAACDAVFKTRQHKRDEDEAKKSAGRRALEEVCAGLDSLAEATDKSEQEVRRAARELQEQWKKLARPGEPSARELEGRYRRALASVESALTTRTRARQTAVWDTLAAKERLCEALDSLVGEDAQSTELGARSAQLQDEWAGLPGLPSAWEKKLLARRDAAIKALAEPATAQTYAERIHKGAQLRREGLLELELLLGLDSPPELQTQRLALQVKQLRDRFKSAVSVGPEAAGERLCEWCAQPGIVEAADRVRSDRVFTAIKRRR